jgi:hypothetical protein
LPAADQIEGGLPRNRLAWICCANSARRSGLSSSSSSSALFFACLGGFTSLEAFFRTRFDPRSPDILISRHTQAIVVFDKPNWLDPDQPAFNAKADTIRRRMVEEPFSRLDPTAVEVALFPRPPGGLGQTPFQRFP